MSAASFAPRCIVDKFASIVNKPNISPNSERSFPVYDEEVNGGRPTAGLSLDAYFQPAATVHITTGILLSALSFFSLLSECFCMVVGHSITRGPPSTFF